MNNDYIIQKCEDTRQPALYRRFDARHPGAMSGLELICHEPDFDKIWATIAAHWELRGAYGFGNTIREKKIMTNQAQFQKLLKDEGIKFFSAKEVFFMGGSNAKLKLNAEPPEHMWQNILPTLHFLDAVRERVGRLQINSAYRSPAYNRAIGGAQNSQHKAFRACDVHPLETSVAELWKVCVALRKEKNFLGGLGKYPGFVHVDCRGYKATW